MILPVIKLNILNIKFYFAIFLCVGLNSGRGYTEVREYFNEDYNAMIIFKWVVFKESDKRLNLPIGSLIESRQLGRKVG